MSEQSDFGRLEGKIDSILSALNTFQVASEGRLATLEQKTAEDHRRITKLEVVIDTKADVMDVVKLKEEATETRRWWIGTVVTAFGLLAVPVIILWLGHK